MSEVVAAMQRNSVFVSYSHQDADWLKRLQVHLKPLTREGFIVFDDTMIKAGTDWRKKIRDAIDSAKLAILLVSADFLASDFIAQDELPPLLEAAESGGVVVIPVIVSPSRFEQTTGISRFQTLVGNRPSRPLISMSPGEQEAVFYQLSLVVEDALHSALTTAQATEEVKARPALHLRFIDDLNPDDDSIVSALEYLKREGTEVMIEWPELNESLFNEAAALRANLQSVLKKKGVPAGDEMYRELSEYDAALDTARFFRENAHQRVVPLWKGMQEQLRHTYFTAPALRHYLIHANLGVLMRLHWILSRVTGRSPRFHGIDVSTLPATADLLHHPTLRALLGVNGEEVFWGARFNNDGLRRVLDRGPIIWAPKSLVIESYRLLAHGEMVTNGFVHRYAVPQAEFEVLYKAQAKDRTACIDYGEDGFAIEQLYDEKFHRTRAGF